MFVLRTKPAMLGSLAFGPSGRTLAAGFGMSNGMAVWDLDTGAGTARHEFGGGVVYRPWPVRLAGEDWFVGGRPEGLLLVRASDGSHRSEELPEFVKGFAVCPVTALSVLDTQPWANPEGPHSSDPWAGLLAGYRLTAGRPPARLWEVPFYGALCDGRFDGDRIVTAESGPDEEGRFVQTVTVREWETGRPVAPPRAASPTGYWVRLAPHGWRLAGLEGPLLRVVTFDGVGTSLGVRNDSRRHFTAVAFHPSGRWLAATSNDATVKLYDTATWQVARSFAWDVGKMRSVAFSPDGTLAAAGSDTGRVVVWDFDG